ncbi:unnamed protein product [Parascedosporium putredinis]|uniref:DUF3824 domain-containing protein n=1 Tax=Parascedosporium putredinis TaxID=1442378 RepID=A0A9P1H1H5_9PEZI|nr:unnamed protein product [Parascedosporium putredinis]CAI7992760.1 unnamed protein product [Parascedosporium putredinis]
MSAYEPYESPRTRHDDRDRDWDRDRDRRHRHSEQREVRETYTKVYPTSRELVPTHREDIDALAVERAYPDPYMRDARRTRSAEPGYYEDDYRERDHQRSRGSHKGGYADSYFEAEEKRRRRVLSRQEKIIAAVAGAALAVGGKEFYDRRAATTKEDDDEARIQRNYIHSAALGAAGAVAGYQGAEFYNKHSVQEYYYSDSDDDPPAKKGHKKFLESALGVTSLGAAMKALTGGGGDDKNRDDRSRRGRSNSRDSARSTRSQPGGWKGEKAKRVVTAAIGAGAIGGAQDDDKHNKRNIAESVIGGLLGNRVLHGSKSNIEEDEKTGRSRSRSRVRSRSENRGRRGQQGRSRSPDDRRRSRSRSVVDSARRGLAKLGLGNDPVDDRDRRDGGATTMTPGARVAAAIGMTEALAGARSDAGSSTDLGDSSDDERRAKKLRGKQIITSGLAAVATIHAAHGVYENMGKRIKQKKALREGRITEEKAHELQSKALLKDTAKIGLAALGVKGALAELKAAQSTSHECKAFRQEKERRHQRRVERQRRLSGEAPRLRARVTGSESAAPFRHYEPARYGQPVPAYRTTSVPGYRRAPSVQRGTW